MEATTLLLGAGIALGSAALGVISEAAKGWIVRRNAIEDRRTAFRHRAAVELQELLFELMRSTARIHIEDTKAYRQTGIWGQNFGSEELAELRRMQLVRARTLLERLGDSQLRSEVEGVLTEAAGLTFTPTKEEADRREELLLTTFKETNQALGKAIRDSWAD